jgi:signal peptidase I
MKMTFPRRRLVRIAIISGAALAALWVSGVRLFAFAGESMVPAVKHGDHFVGLIGVWNLRTPKRFEMVIFDVPNTSKWAGQKIPWMKRLVGLPGEHIRLSGDRLFVNGRQMDAPFLYSARAPGQRKDFEVTLRADEYFVLGDNLDWTLQDSRAMGPIPASLMKGFVPFSVGGSGKKPNKTAVPPP